MQRGNSLTISACSGRRHGPRAELRRASSWLAALGCLLLAACTIEVGPPPESDPLPVPQSAKTPPPPAQPTEPQPWSRDLDFDSAPAAVDRRQMVEGLVAGDVEANYSGERLTFESALDAEKPPSEAELARQRAVERAAAAGLPAPPQVAAAPVTEVEAAALPAPGAAAAEAESPRRASRLPPPPKFPPQNAKPAAAAAPETSPPEASPPEASPAAAKPAAAELAPAEQWAQRGSRLPPPPKFPPLTPAASQTAAAAAPESEAAAAEQAAGFVTETWDAPVGTILVQVSAIPDGGKVAQEWERLQALYPQVLKPLRLVVEQARLGERGVFYRVQAGAFGTQEGAAAACNSLISQGQPCFVVVR